MAWRLGIACVAVSAWDGGDGGVCPGGTRGSVLADPQVSGPEPTQTAVTVQTPIACNATRRTASCLAAGSVRVDRPGRWNHLTVAPAITAAAFTAAFASATVATTLTTTLAAAAFPTALATALTAALAAAAIPAALAATTISATLPTTALAAALATSTVAASLAASALSSISRTIATTTTTTTTTTTICLISRLTDVTCLIT